MTGSGLHVILNFSEPVQIQNEAEQNAWAHRVEIVQAALPIDPDQPGITATTRALGSVNSKNARRVEQLTAGQPIKRGEIEALADELVNSPFKTFLRVLTGSTCITPCPFCGLEGTKLDALDYIGKCYGSCGKVGYQDLWEQIYQPRADQGDANGN
jgi:hypothetical protein